MANINIQIPDDIHKQLKLDALKADLTLKAFIIQQLELGLKKVKR